MPNYEIGRQPCQNFKPMRDGNGHATWDNQHDCLHCEGTVSFCETCSRDHHANGYDTCNRSTAAPAALSREEIERWRTILRDTFTDGEGEYPPEPDALCDLALLALTSDAARGGEGMSDFEKWQQIGASRHPREWLAANQAAVNAANYCRADLTDKATRELITRVVVHVLDTVLPKAKP